MLTIIKSDFISNHTISFINSAGVAPNPVPNAEMCDAVMVNAVTPMYVLMMHDVLEQNIEYGMSVTRLKGILGACIKDMIQEEQHFCPTMLVKGIKIHPAAYMSVPRFNITEKDGMIYLTPLICATIKICFTVDSGSGSMFWVMDNTRSLMYDKTLAREETGIVGLVDDARILALEPIENQDILGNNFTYSCKDKIFDIDSGILRLANVDAVWLSKYNTIQHDPNKSNFLTKPCEELAQYIVLHDSGRSTEEIASSGDMYRRMTPIENNSLRKETGKHIHIESVTKVMAQQMIKVLEFDKARLSEIPDFIDFDELISYYSAFI